MQNIINQRQVISPKIYDLIKKKLNPGYTFIKKKIVNQPILNENFKLLDKYSAISDEVIKNWHIYITEIEIYPIKKN